MRLVCPKCAAEYEIAPEMIPESGRDVQCSACGHTWFHLTNAKTGSKTPAATDDTPSHPTDAPADAAAPDTGQGAPGTPAPDADNPDTGKPNTGKPGKATPDDAGSDTGTAGGAVTDQKVKGDPDAPPRPRELDAATRAILEEEAERETAARRRDATGSRQSASGPTSAAPSMATSGAAAGGTAAMAATGAAARSAPAKPAGQPQSRALPDAEKINSTLSNDRQRNRTSDPNPVTTADDEDDLSEGRGGFAFGFWLVILLAAAAIAIYLAAPILAENFPAVEPQLAAYVAWVNEFRVTLDGWIDRAMDMVSGEPE